MRFSQVIGEAYHKISLPKSQRDRLDIYFTGAAHHLLRYRQTTVGTAEEQFHDLFFREHIRELMHVVYEHGDFGMAIDPTGRGLHLRSTWDPKYFASKGLPDPQMFHSMNPDPRFGLSMNHPNDFELRRLPELLTELNIQRAV